MPPTVRQTNVAPDSLEDAKPRLFSEFADRSNLVLLGDPGAGKTHLFREAAAENARLLKVRSFLVTPAHMLAGQTLFIDGLDEKRAGRGDRDTIDAIVEKLFEVSPSKVRISCRAADWLGETDLAAP
jgi:predicted NACHT family NTPase